MSVLASAWALPKPFPYGRRPRRAAEQGPRLGRAYARQSTQLAPRVRIILYHEKILPARCQVDSSCIYRKALLWISQEPLDNSSDHCFNSVRATQSQIQAKYMPTCQSLIFAGPAAAARPRKCTGAALGSAPRLVVRSPWLHSTAHTAGAGSSTVSAGSKSSAGRGSSAIARVQADFVLVPWDASQETWWVVYSVLGAETSAAGWRCC